MTCRKLLTVVTLFQILYRCMNLFHLPVLSLHKLHGGRPGSSLVQMTERMCTGPHSVVSAAHSCTTTGIQLEKTVSRKETERYKMHILWHNYNTRISCLWEMCMCPHTYIVRCDPYKHNYIDINEMHVESDETLVSYCLLPRYQCFCRWGNLCHPQDDRDCLVYIGRLPHLHR